MLLFFAATESKSHRDAALKGGAKNSLQSFYSLGCGRQIPNNKDFENYLLDSGGYSARKHGVDINVEDYARYLNDYNIEFAFNLDVKDNHKSLENQRYLESHTKTYILPVYHGTEWGAQEWKGLLEYYIEHYPYIALGGMAGKENSRENIPRFLDHSFSKIKDKVMVHGLGMTTGNLLKRYPFYTVDSTSWMSPALFASSKIHGEKYMKANAKSRHFSKNSQEEVAYWLDLEGRITRLWEKRGIKWRDFDYNKIISQRKKNIPTFKEWKERNG